MGMGDGEWGMGNGEWGMGNGGCERGEKRRGSEIKITIMRRGKGNI